MAALLDGDRSRISLAIALLYLLGTIHCARRVWALSAQLDEVLAVEHAIGDNQVVADRNGKNLQIAGVSVDGDSALGAHLSAIGRSATLTPREQNSEGQGEVDNSAGSITELLVANQKGPHEIGWFVVDILLKLGLIGTIVGFILMLSSVANTASLDVNTMQKVLKQMSAGMGTALFTTLAGLTGSILLGLQYLLLDKTADSLIERIVALAETRVRVG